MNANTLTVAGLCCGMIGVLFLFKWGPPQPSLEKGVALGLEDGTPYGEPGKTVADYNRDVEAQRKQYTCLSRIGLGLLGVGFALQLVGVLVAM